MLLGTDLMALDVQKKDPTLMLTLLLFYITLFLFCVYDLAQTLHVKKSFRF